MNPHDGGEQMNPHDEGLEAAASAVLEVILRTEAGARFVTAAGADVHGELAEVAVEAYSAVLFDHSGTELV